MDPRIHRDIHRLSTEMLVTCITILGDGADLARRAGNYKAADDFTQRLRLCRMELASRQLTLLEDLADPGPEKAGE